MADNDNVARLNVFEEGLLRRPVDGGNDGGMPPGSLETRVERLEDGVKAVRDAVEKLGAKIDALGDKVGGLAERVSVIEGQLRHIPTLTGVIVGQVVAAAAVAGVIVGAITFGTNLGKSPPSPPVQAAATAEPKVPAMAPAAPAAPQAPTNVDPVERMFVLMTTVPFEINSAELTPEARKRIEPYVRKFDTVPALLLRAYVPPSMADRSLALQRAVRVREYLVERGYTGAFEIALANSRNETTDVEILVPAAERRR